MSAVDKTKMPAATNRQNRFPIAVRELRRKFPNGTLIRVCFTTANGDTVTYEGKLGEEFLKLARAMLDATGSN